MEIVDVRATPISCPLGGTYAGSNYAKATRDTTVVTIETDAGITGRTYAGDFGDVGRDQHQMMYHFLMDELRPELVGENPLAVIALSERLYSHSKRFLSFMPRKRWLYVHAVGAIDAALWDVVGKAADLPLYRLWGGYRDSLPIIAIGGYDTGVTGLSELVDEMKTLRETGFAGVKLKVGHGSLDRDVERVRAVRDAMGEEFVIGCDANQAWSATEAVEFAQSTSQYELRWLEEPVAWYDQYEGMATVRRRTGVPITAGQSEISPMGCKRLIEKDAVDILNYDASWGGGPSVWHRIASLATLQNIQMMHHEEPHLAMHLLASVPNGLFVEAFSPELDPFFFELIRNTPSIQDGCLRLPSTPGLGLELDEQFIQKHEIDDFPGE